MSPLRRAALRTFRSLQTRNYRLYFFGQMISMTGTWVQIVAQGWLVLEMTGSGVAVGVVTGLQFLPVLLAGPWGGVLADRLDKRSLVISAQVVAAALALLLGIVTAAGVVELWMIYLLAFLLGCVTVVDVPARQSFVMEMVEPDDVANAVGLNTTVFTSARVIGPAISGVLISVVGIAPCFFINALSYVAVIAGLLAMDRGELRHVDPIPRAKGQIREGFAYVWSRRELRSTMLLLAVVGTLAFNFRVLLPLMARSTFGGGAGLYGTLSAALGAGTVVGALVSAARARPTRNLLVASAFAFGVLMITAGVASNLALAVLALVPLGAVSMAFITTVNSSLQLASIDAMRGRVMALYSVLFLGTTPIGSPFVGWLAERFGVTSAFVIPGLATMAAALLVGVVLRRSGFEGGAHAHESEPQDVPVGAPGRETLPQDEPVGAPMTDHYARSPAAGEMQEQSPVVGTASRP